MEYRQFLDGINRKEDKAWVELYDYFYAPLCCYAAKIMGNDQMVEDVVQGCFVKLWLSDQKRSVGRGRSFKKCRSGDLG